MRVQWSAYDPRPRAPRSRRGGRARALRPVAGAVLEEVIDPAHLDRVWKKMAAENGRAPGVDGVRPDDLSAGERFQLLRDVRAAVLAGTFRPQPLRAVHIPKADNSKRTLKLAVYPDRVPAKAVADALTPLAERVFSSASYGFRPKRDRFQLLADLKAYCETHDAWVITPADVKKAFDSVPVDRAVLALRRLEAVGADPELVALAVTLVQGHTPEEVSIPQGNPLSPMVLNLVLHDALDATLTAARGGRTPAGYWRYADDLVIATPTAAEGRAQLDRTRALLAGVGLRLKREHGEHPDLAAGDHLEVLGLRLTRTGTALSFDIPHKKWADLRTKLAAAHDEPNPTAAARVLAIGWAHAHAPALGSNQKRIQEYANRVHNLLHRTGHRRALTRTQIARILRTAADRWERTVTEARNRQATPTAPTPTPDPTPHTSDVGVDHRDGEADEDADTTVTVPVATTADREGTTAAGTVTNSTRSSTDFYRPSGRPTALPGRPAIPPSATPRRARSTSPARPEPSRPPTRTRSGRSPAGARPPPGRP